MAFIIQQIIIMSYYVERGILGAGESENSGNSSMKKTSRSMVCQGQDRESRLGSGNRVCIVLESLKTITELTTSSSAF